MPHKGRLLDKGSFLASLLFLKHEASRDGFDRTAKAVEQAIGGFFEDLRQMEELDHETILVRNLLVNAMALNETSLLKFIELVQSLENDNATLQ